MRAELEPLLAEHGAWVDEIDIDLDPALEARFNDRVPVLMLDAIELCHYRLDIGRVRAALIAAKPVCK
jgi:hypothetical protein